MTEARHVLFDPFFAVQEYYSSLDCVYHTVFSGS